MKIINEIVINKSVNNVWEVVGNQFSNAYEWASVLRHSEGRGEKNSAQVCDSRSCYVNGMGHTHEKLTEFDPDRHTLTYEVTKGFPFFVKRGANRWLLISEGNQTRVFMSAEIETKGCFGKMMEPMMKVKMSSMLQTIAEDLKFYVENEQPHPRNKKGSRQ